MLWFPDAGDYIDVRGFSDSDDDYEWWDPDARWGPKVQVSVSVTLQLGLGKNWKCLYGFHCCCKPATP